MARPRLAAGGARQHSPVSVPCAARSAGPRVAGRNSVSAARFPWKSDLGELPLGRLPTSDWGAGLRRLTRQQMRMLPVDLRNLKPYAQR